MHIPLRLAERHLTTNNVEFIFRSDNNSITLQITKSSNAADSFILGDWYTVRTILEN